MKTACVALLALVAGAACATDVAEPSALSVVAASAYPRGGNLLITNSDAAATASDAYFVAHKTSPALADLSGTPVNAANVADVLSHALGVAAPNPDFAPAQAGAKLSKAALLFTVHSAGVTALNEGHMPVLSTLSNSAISLGARVSTPASAALASPLALLNTAVRGVTPRVHGVTACSWAASPQQGDVVSAMTAAPAAAPAVASVADRLAQSFDGRSLQVAVSGNEKLANSLGLHPELAASFGTSDDESALNTQNWNVATIAADAAAGTARYTDYSARKFSAASNALTANALIAATEAAMADPVSVLSSPLARLTRDAEQGSMLVSVKFVGEPSIPQLDLADPLQAALVNELAAVKAALTTALSGDAFASLRADNAPDMFSAAVVGLKPIALRDGTDSPLYAVAARLVDAVFGDLRNAASAAYGDALTVSALLLGTPAAAPAFTETQRAAVEAAVAEALKGQPVNTAAFPSLFASPAALAAPEACARVAAAVAAAVPSARAHCVAEAVAKLGNAERAAVGGLARRLAASAPAVAGANGEATFANVFIELDSSVSVSAAGAASASAGVKASILPWPAQATETVVHYQIVLWTSLALVFIAVAALYNTATMTFKKDAQLWSGLNPAWTRGGGGAQRR